MSEAGTPNMAGGLGMLEVLVVTVLGSACVYFLILRLPKGFFRLFAVLPLLAIYVSIPWRATTAHAQILSTFLLVWMASFKILLICWDAGFANDPCAMSSFPCFFIALNFPIGVPYAHHRQENVQVPRTVLLLSTLKVLFLIPFYRLYDFRDSFPSLLIYSMYTLHIYIACSACFDGFAALGSLMVGLEMRNLFDKPYMAESVSEFWGRRWNPVVSSVLRASVYEPILNLAKECKQERPAFVWSAFATLAVFMVSGVMHDIIFFFMSRQPLTWEATAFFLLQGTAMLLETTIRKAWPGRPKVPKQLSVLFTTSFLFLTAVWLFYPPFCRPGSDLRLIQEFNDVQALILSNVSDFLKMIHKTYFASF